MGETHLAVALEKLARKFGVNVDTEDVRVPYRETITGPAEAEGKYKKQTGGHGQFGVAWLRVEPLERGAGFEFVDKIVGGAIPRQFIPAVQKGIEETMAEGGVHGFPVVDVRVELLRRQVPPRRLLRDELQDGRLARLPGGDGQGRRRSSWSRSRCCEVTVPAAYQGDVMGDLNARRGRVQGTETVGDGEQEVTGLGADVGDPALRHRPAVDDRRPGPVHRRARATTTSLPGHLVDKAKASLAATHA